MSKSIELRQERNAILAKAREVNDRADAEKRDLTTEEQSGWDSHMEAMKALDERIKRAEYLEATPEPDEEKRSFLNLQDQKADPPKTEQEAKDRNERQYSTAFRDYLQRGRIEMDDANREILMTRGVELSKEDRSQLVKFQTAHPEFFRAQEVGSQAAGGFWAPSEAQRQIEEALLYYGGMRSSGANIITTDTGNDLPWPVFNDTGNSGRRIAENAAFTETDIAVGVRTMKAFMYSSDEILVSWQFLQDVPIEAESFINSALGKRVGRIQNNEFTIYNAPDGPQGITAASTLGVTAAATGSITADELLNLQYSVDRAYRTPGAAYMMADATLRNVMQLKDGDGRYLFIPDVRVTQEPTIHGRRVVINNDMPALATGNITVEFGDFSHYVIRDVRGFTVLRLNEIRARNGQVVFLGFARADGAYINAGGNPIKHLIQA